MPQHQIYSSPLAQGLASWQWPRTLRKLTFEFCQFIFNRGVSWPTCNVSMRLLVHLLLGVRSTRLIDFRKADSHAALLFVAWFV